jgi:hypothetical protein
VLVAIHSVVYLAWALVGTIVYLVWLVAYLVWMIPFGLAAYLVWRKSFDFLFDQLPWRIRLIPLACIIGRLAWKISFEF